MRFIFMLLASFVVSVPAYAAWPADTHRGALVSCELEKTSEFIMKLGPLKTEAANQQALKLCACLVEKAEQKNPRPPQSEAEMKQRLVAVSGACADGGSTQSAQFGPSQTLRDFMTSCNGRGKPVPGDWVEQKNFYFTCVKDTTKAEQDRCQCLVSRAQAADPENKVMMRPEWEVKAEELTAAVERAVKKFGKNCPPNTSAIDEVQLRKFIYSDHSNIRLKDAATMRRFGPVMGLYACSDVQHREPFYRCMRVANMKRREQLKLDVTAPLSDDEAEKIQRGCMKQFPPSK